MSYKVDMQFRFTGLALIDGAESPEKAKELAEHVAKIVLQAVEEGTTGVYRLPGQSRTLMADFSLVSKSCDPVEAENIVEDS